MTRLLLPPLITPLISLLLGITLWLSGSARAAEPITSDGTYPIFSDGVYSLRSWKVAKGTFAGMLDIHQQSVMPFYQRLGVRYLGFWMEIPGPDHEGDAEYDKVYMLTRYDSIEHWQKTRAPWAWGAGHEEFLRMAVAIGHRGRHVVEEHHQFLRGHEGHRPTAVLTRQPGTGALSSEAFLRACRASAGAQQQTANYCGCLEQGISDGLPSPWARPMALAWLSIEDREQPSLTAPVIQNLHLSCAGVN